MRFYFALRDAWVRGCFITFSLYLHRYRSLGSLEQKRLEEDEDKVLGTTLFNLTAFMIHLNVEKSEMKKKVRRIIGKAHIGMSQSQCVGQLLAKLDYVVSFWVFSNITVVIRHGFAS